MGVQLLQNMSDELLSEFVLICGSLSVCFKKYMNGQATFETARDAIRHELHSQSPAQFPYGTRGTSVAALTSAILAPHDFVAISSPECTNCEYSEPPINDRLEFVLYEKEDMPKSIHKWLGSLEHETHEKCPHCFSAMMQPISFKSIPSVLVFEINSRNIKVSYESLNVNLRLVLLTRVSK